MTDRELDALVAEKVMGCSTLSEDGAGEPTCSCPPLEGCTGMEKHGIHGQGRAHECCGYDDCRYACWQLRRYSADIAAAWEVVEKLGDDDFSISMHGTGWKVWFGSNWRGAETAPRAICLAALAAVGVEVKE